MYFKKIYTYLKNIDNGLIDEYVKYNNKLNISIPKDRYSTFVRISGCAEFFYMVKNKFIGKKNSKRFKCLVVGLHGGRDYWGGVAVGWDMWGMDLEKVKDIANMKIGNAEKVWPFATSEFDLVIMGEILEHLVYDVVAIKEAKRVLNQQGRLIVTVPYYDSNDSFHIRMHNEETLTHVVNISGLEVIERCERPGIPFKNFLNYLNSFVAVLMKLVFNRNFYFGSVKFYGELEYFLSKKKLFRKLFKFLNLNNFGGCVVCSKLDIDYDYININKEKFNNK